MKALLCTQFGALDQLTVQEVAVPQPGTGQIRVDIKAASLNFPDALMVQGLYQFKPPLPFTPGTEFAGIVSALGAGVNNLKIGDRVIGMSLGGFAEEALVEADRAIPMPAEMGFDIGAGLMCTYGTTIRALTDCAHLKPGESLLVLGAAGGVGVAAVEIGKAMGARVIAAASTDEKLALCRRLGADETINYATENLRERLKAITGERGVDVVYDPVGGPFTEPALRSTGWGGRLLVIGFAAGDIPKIPINLCLLRERSLIGVFWGDSVKNDPAAHQRNVVQLFTWIANGSINPYISERVPLAQAADLMTRMTSRQVTGKAIVLPEA